MSGALMVAMSGRYFWFEDVISTSISNYHLRNRALAAGWDGVKKLKASVTFTGASSVGSAHTTVPAVETGAPFPVDSDVLLTIESGCVVLGKGGDGGKGGDFAGNSHPVGENGAAGDPGGPALKAETPIRINNLGTIAGGGGGGGGGGAGAGGSGSSGGGGGGGGGAGGGVSNGGAGGIGDNVSGSGVAGGVGSNPFPGSGGAGGDGDGGNGGDNDGGPGGAGGNFGAAGSPGATGEHDTVIEGFGAPGTGGPGGPAGQAVLGNSFITWVNTGTRLGAIG